MRSARILLQLQLLLAGVLLAATAAAASASSAGLVCDSTEAERALVLERALGTLREAFELQRGNLSFHMGGNPQGRYGVSIFSEDLLPPGLKKAGKVTAGFPIPINASFVLGLQDAVFWFGCTPPPVRYFSIRSYLAYRFLPPAEGQAFYNVTGLMPAAELGDPTNHMVIKTTGGAGSPFSKTTLFVSTGDLGTYRRIREAFRAAGFPEEAMNLDVLPAEKVNFRHAHRPWVLDRSDTIAWQFRVNEFINPADAEGYLSKSWPIFMLQAKGGSTAVAPQPLQAPKPRPRGTGESEEWLRPTLDQLKEAVVARFAARGMRLANIFPMAPNVPDADRCMVDFSYCPVASPVPAWNRTDCIATCDWFTRDSLYSMPAKNAPYEDFLIPQNRSMVLLGVNHPMISKSSFLNILVTGVRNPERPGHTPNVSSTHLAGSGHLYLPEVAAAEVLYAHELSRDCGDRPFCETVTKESIDYDEFIYFAERAYLEPFTAIGPSPDEIISPVILAFDPIEEAAAGARAPVRLRGPCSSTGSREVTREER